MLSISSKKETNITEIKIVKINKIPKESVYYGF